MKHLIIFADYGLDDAAATVTLFNKEHLFSHIDIVPVGGNVPVDISFRNCLTLLSYFPSLQSKISVIDARHIKQPAEFLSEIHGNDGMGDVLSPQVSDNDFEIIKYEEWLNTVDGTECILSLGPMTLVKPLMERFETYEPVIMGGCVHSSPNYNGYEFNHGMDKSAFAFCTKRKHAAITLDTCRVKELDMRNIEITGNDIHSVILKADQELSISRQEEGCFIWDDVAAAYLLYPERFVLIEEKDIDGNRLFNAKYISEKIYYED